jgi:hypothetical protein
VWPELSDLAEFTWGKARRWRETSQASSQNSRGNVREIGERKMARAVLSKEVKLSISANAFLIE